MTKIELNYYYKIQFKEKIISHSIGRQMISKETRNIIQNLSYIQCEDHQHEGQDKSLICMDELCEGKRLACCYCEQSSHKDHLVFTLKDYLSHLYAQKESNKILLKQSNITNAASNGSLYSQNQCFMNYASYIQSIQNTKLSALKQLHCIRQKFIDQLALVQNQIEVNTTKYVQKVMLLSRLHYGKEDIVAKINKFVQQNNLSKCEALLSKYIQNFNPPQQNDNSSTVSNSLQKDIKPTGMSIVSNVMNFSSTQAQTVNNQKMTKNVHHPQLQKVYESFQSKMENFQKSLNLFDFGLFPKLRKILHYENIKFTGSVTLYDWDPLVKSKNFQIDPQNTKILRVKSNSSNGERFALMSAGFPSNSKKKYSWAVKINKLVGWIALGLGLKKCITEAQLKFVYNTVGHGSYLISANGYSWSHFQGQNNSKMQSFSFYTGDTIVIEYNALQKTVLFRKVNSNSSFQMKVAQYSSVEVLCPCVNMCSVNDEVEIVPLPTGFM